MRRFLLVIIAALSGVGIYAIGAASQPPDDLKSPCFQREGVSATQSISECIRVLADKNSSARARSEANFLLGYVYAGRKETQTAIKYFDEALRIDPTKAIAAYNRALIHVHDPEQIETAFADLTMVMTRLENGQFVRPVLRDKLLDIYAMRIAILMEMQAFDAVLDEGLRLKGKDDMTGSELELFRLLIATFRYAPMDEAARLVGFDRIAEHLVENAQLWTQLSDAYGGLKHYGDAIKSMQRALALSPDREDYETHIAKLRLLDEAQ